jgi:hypothetical protein
MLGNEKGKKFFFLKKIQKLRLPTPSNTAEYLAARESRTTE